MFGRGASAFRRRFALGALAVIALLVAFGSVLAWHEYDDGKRRALQEMQTRVVLASTVFDTYFAGQLSTLSSIAAAPSVVRVDTPQMAAYFSSLQGGTKRQLFTGGLGWIDRAGKSRVSDTSPKGSGVSVADRAYFKAVVSTGRPYISEGLQTRVGQRRVVIMAVPTRDARGRITGVLAGALQIRPSRTNSRTTDLGFEGLVIVDRAGQELTLTNFARPQNLALLKRLRSGDGVVSDTRGLDGSSDRAVAFANSKAPDWITIIDRPRSMVFASARHSLFLELASIAAASLVVLLIVGWAIVRSRREFEEERQQVRNWDELAQSLGEAAAAAEVSAALGAAVVSSFPEAEVIVALESEDGRAMRTWTFGPGSDAPVDQRREDALEIARLAFDANAPLKLAGRADADGQRVEDDPLAGVSGSVYAIPIQGDDGAAIGSVTLLLPRGHAFGDADEALVLAHTDHAARALTRASRHELEHDVAVSLQRSLLPEELPTVDGLELAGRYMAGGVGLEVGGDWYDAVRRPDGILHLSVGDVSGRGITAAVLMGQLRNAFRALAYEHTSPVEIARRLTRLVPDSAMATAVFITLDPYTGELRYSSAGHPPSILLDGVTGTTILLDQAASPPLGWTDPKAMPEAVLALPSQMTLLAYTDGLVERRGAVIDDGITRLVDLLQERPELGADATSDRLLREVVAPLSATDDIALLLVRINEVPAVMRVEIPSEPSVMRGLRARLELWLGRRGLNRDQRADTILAVSEACNNAIEHGYRQGAGTIRITLEHRAGALRIAIEDDGTWRPPITDPTRGRGMTIMEGTMDSVIVTPGETGTRVDLEIELADHDR